MKSSASSWSESCSGSFLSAFTSSQSPTARNSAFWSEPHSLIRALNCITLASSQSSTRRSRQYRRSCLSISSRLLLHILSTIRAVLLVASISPVLQKFSGRTVISLCLNGACLSSKLAKPTLYWSMRPSASAAGLVMSGRSIRSSLKDRPKCKKVKQKSRFRVKFGH
jgi:hypothetical protein